MKIIRQQLKQIIKEELESALESPPADNSARAIELLLDFMLDRIISTYDGEIPPAVQKMADLIEARDYDTIRSDFNRMWTDLVQYHRDTGIKLQPRVSHNFRSIGTTIRSL
jgi:hypothetical protein